MPTVMHYDHASGREVPCEILRVTHHTDAGYAYSRVYLRFPDGGSTFYFAQGHHSPEGIAEASQRLYRGISQVLG